MPWTEIDPRLEPETARSPVIHARAFSGCEASRSAVYRYAARVDVSGFPGAGSPGVTKCFDGFLRSRAPKRDTDAC